MARGRGGKGRHREDGAVEEGSGDLKLTHPPYETADTEQAKALGPQCHLQ